MGKINRLFKKAETPKGSIGYDNPRENIDPALKTKVLFTREISGQNLQIVSGSIVETPLRDEDIANKKYVDDSVAVEDLWDRAGDVVEVKTSTDRISGANLTVSGSLIYTDDDKVGIGTATPDRKLDVLDASNPQLRLARTDNSIYTDFKTNASGKCEITGNDPGLAIGGDGIGRAVQGWKTFTDITGTSTAVDCVASAVNTTGVKNTNYVRALAGQVKVPASNTGDWGENLFGLFYGVNLITPSTGSYTIDGGTGIYLSNAVNTNTTAGKILGIRILNTSGGGTLTTQYGLYIDNLTKGATNYAIYSAGGKVYLNGNVGIKTTTFDSATNGLEVRPSAVSKFGVMVTNTTGARNAGLYTTGAGYGGLYLYKANGSIGVNFLADSNSYISGGNFGLDTTSPQEKLDIAGSLLFSKSGEGLQYGGFHEHAGSDIQLVADGSFTQISGANYITTPNNGVTLSGAVLKVTYPGHYKVDWSLSASSAGTNQDYDIDVFKNTIDQDEAAARRKFGAANDVGNMGSTGIIQADANDYFDLRVKGNGTTSALTIYDIDMTLVQVGG